MSNDLKYNVIYADPPWSYKSGNGRGFKHGAKAKYTTGTPEWIKAFPIDQVADNNAVLLCGLLCHYCRRHSK